MSGENKQQSIQETQEEKDQEQLDPVDLMRMERETGKSNKGWSSGQKLNYFILKIIILIFIVVSMGMCSFKYIS